MCRAANFEQELGVIAACQAVGLQFNGVHRCRFLQLGTDLCLPGQGPPQVLGHRFPGLVPSGNDIVTRLRVLGKLYFRI